MFSTTPLASARSLPASAEAWSVSISWNFTDELPQLRTSTFMRPIVRRDLVRRRKRTARRRRACEGASGAALSRLGAAVFVVLEEAAAALHAEMPGSDHLAQQRAGTVLEVAQLLEQVLHPAAHLVEADAVGERQRAD